MKVNVRYGNTFKSVDVPENALVLKKSDVSRVENVEDKIKKVLNEPIGTPPLIEIAKGRKNACIIVSDITRPVPNSIILPPLIEVLERAGISDTTILIANGTHDPVPEDMFEELLGKETLKHNVKIVNHDAYDNSKLVNLGMAVHNCPSIVNETYIQSDLKICTGLIEPHFMAGFSGGRKSICPGITGMETLKVFHGVDAMAHPLSKSCSLDGNPVDEIAKSVAKMAGCDFMLNVTLDDERKITGIFAGDLFKAHKVGCDYAAKTSIVEVEKPADVVITSNGGYPLDQNYYQTAKGLVEAAEIVKPNGVIIMSSECKMGVGKKTFQKLLLELKEKGTKAFLESHKTSETFESDQWEVQKISQVLEKTRNIFLLSKLKENDYPLTFAKKISSLNEGLEKAKEITGDNPIIVVIPEGPYVVSRIKNDLI
jgi:nickel-dependent lactate racemase